MPAQYSAVAERECVGVREPYRYTLAIVGVGLRRIPGFIYSVFECGSWYEVGLTVIPQSVGLESNRPRFPPAKRQQDVRRVIRRMDRYLYAKGVS